jgi:hypothetical protein
VTSGRRSAALQVACGGVAQGSASTPEASSMRPNPALLEQGWTHRCLAEPARAEEARALYTSLNFEVMLVTPEPWQFAEACKACAAACHHYLSIYTRRRARD